ncbi:MAG: hypothetical protein Q8838_02645 [Candidatus Phytoplasma australasiaticum]|nr:hypothetical protein [Candidatus Phytoplasma australasiaticum]
MSILREKQSFLSKKNVVGHGRSTNDILFQREKYQNRALKQRMSAQRDLDAEEENHQENKSKRKNLYMEQIIMDDGAEWIWGRQTIE